MKTFNKIALVSAIAVAPFTQAMEALDDSVLGETTGQAGVTIDLSIGDAGVTIGTVTYTDTKGDEANAGLTGGGSVVLENVSIKNVNSLKQTIDVAESGNLIMGMSGADQLKLKTVGADGTVTNGADIAGGLGVAGIQIEVGNSQSTSALMLQGANGTKAELVDSITMNVDIGNSTTTIYNLANAPKVDADPANDVVAAAAGTLGAVGVTGANAALKPSMAIGMDSSFRINNMNVGVFGYTEAQATTQVGAMDTGLASTTPAVATATAVSTNNAIAKYNKAKGLTSGDAGFIADAAAGTALSSAQKAALTTLISTGTAVGIKNLSFVGLDGGLVSAKQTIWADSKGVNIQMGSIAGNLNIGSIEIGGASIGSVSVSNLNLAGMTQTIYGH